MSLLNSYPDYVKRLPANQRATLKEQKSFLFIKPEQPVEIVVVDKGVIPERPNQRMCDFLIYDDKRKVSSFIELKGAAVRDACKQIHATVEYFESDPVLMQAVTNMELLKGYIVSPHCNVPIIDDTDHKKAYRKLHAKSRSKLANVYDHLVFVRCVTPKKSWKQGP